MLSDEKQILYKTNVRANHLYCDGCCPSAKINEDKKKEKKSIVQTGTTANFAVMLHLLTISLARPWSLQLSGGYCYHSYQGSQPASLASINREHQENPPGSEQTVWIHRGRMHCVTKERWWQFWIREAAASNVHQKKKASSRGCNKCHN